MLNITTDNNPVIFHEKQKYQLNGYSMYELILEEVKFQYVPFFKRQVCRVDDIDILQKWQSPLLVSIRDKIQDQYNVRIKGLFVNHYDDGKQYAPYHKDTYNGTSGVFTISCGGTREFLTKQNQTKPE